MKKTLLAILLLAALPALAGDHTLTLPAAAESVYDTATRVSWNAEVCAFVGLPASCTQPQARNAFCARAGLASGCTYNTARDAFCVASGAAEAPCDALTRHVAIATTQDELLLAILLQDADAIALKKQKAAALTGCARWKARIRSEKDAICTSSQINLGAGCEICQ